MKFRLPWQKRSQKNDLLTIEKQLSGVLKPVQPRSEFVQNLRAQLIGAQEKKVLGLTTGKWQNGLLVFGGVISAVLMVMAGMRALVTLLGTLGVLGQVKKQIDESVPSAKQKPA